MFHKFIANFLSALARYTFQEECTSARCYQELVRWHVGICCIERQHGLKWNAWLWRVNTLFFVATTEFYPHYLRALLRLATPTAFVYSSDGRTLTWGSMTPANRPLNQLEVSGRTTQWSELDRPSAYKPNIHQAIVTRPQACPYPSKERRGSRTVYHISTSAL